MAKKKADEPQCLSFIGDGSQYIYGVPAADLHDVEPSEAEGYIASGLYKANPGCGHAAELEELAKPQPAPETIEEPTEPPVEADETGDDS